MSTQACQYCPASGLEETGLIKQTRNHRPRHRTRIPYTRGTQASTKHKKTNTTRGDRKYAGKFFTMIAIVPTQSASLLPSTETFPHISILMSPQEMAIGWCALCQCCAYCHALGHYSGWHSAGSSLILYRTLYWHSALLYILWPPWPTISPRGDVHRSSSYLSVRDRSASFKLVE